MARTALATAPTRNGLHEQRQRVLEPFLGTIEHPQHRIAGLHRIAHSCRNHDTDGGIDLVINLIPAAAQHHRRTPDETGVQSRQRTRLVAALMMCSPGACGNSP